LEEMVQQVRLTRLGQPAMLHYRGLPTTSIELTLALPDSLAREAEAAGLLTPKAIEQLISEAVRRQRVDRLFDAADRLASLNTLLYCGKVGLAKFSMQRAAAA
jgi:hypothetical protein